MKDIVVGEDILKLTDLSGYNIHFPYRRGDIHIHSGKSKILQAIMNGNTCTIICSHF